MMSPQRNERLLQKLNILMFAAGEIVNPVAHFLQVVYERLRERLTLYRSAKILVFPYTASFERLSDAGRN